LGELPEIVRDHPKVDERVEDAGTATLRLYPAFVPLRLTILSNSELFPGMWTFISIVDPTSFEIPVGRVERSSPALRSEINWGTIGSRLTRKGSLFMKRAVIFKWWVFSVATFITVLPLPLRAAERGRNLVSNPGFETREPAGRLPAVWTTSSRSSSFQLEG